MPSKGSDSRIYIDVSGRYQNVNNPNWTVPTHETRVLASRDSRLTSDNIVGWRDLMKAGMNVTTSLQAVQHGIGTSYGIADVRHTQILLNFEAFGPLMQSVASYPLQYVAPSDLVEEARSQAEIAFSKQFNKKVTQWQSGVSAVEVFELAKMLASPARTLRKEVSNLYDLTKKVFKGHRGGSTPRLRRALSDTYLEWKFGVLPTIQDADDAARAFRALASRRTFDMVRMHGKGSSSRVISDTLVNFHPHSVLPSDPKWQMRVLDKVTVTCDLRGAWKNSTINGEMPVPMIFGLGLKDVLPTAWELLPWSFFADYFANIGDVLGAWSMRAVNFSWLNMTTRIVREQVYTPPPNVTANGYLFRTQGLKPLRVYRKDVTRGAYDNSWTPTPVIRIPGVGETSKWLNVAALLDMRLPPKLL